MPQGALLTRWGGYESATRFPQAPFAAKVVIDLSGVLLGSHLGVLERVEETFGVVWLPPSLPQAMLALRAELAPLQPARLAALESIELLLQSGALRVRDGDASTSAWEAIPAVLSEDMGSNWTQLVLAAHATNGLVVGFTPTRRLDQQGPPRGLSKDVEAILVGCRDVAESLRYLGVIPGQDLATALARLGTEGVAGTGAGVITARTHLYLCPAICGLLAEAGILEKVCGTFNPSIDGQERDRLRSELAAMRANRTLSEWLGTIARHVSEGLDKGTYALCPQPALDKTDSSLPPDPASRVLAESLAIDLGPDDVLWIEDRCISRNAAPWRRNIVGVVEVLRALRHYDAIDDDTYYEKVLRLRRSRVYFIPADSEELLWHLERSCGASGFKETPALAALRQYFAAALDAEVFIVPDAVGEYLGEAPFVMQILQAVADAFAAVWASDKPVPLKQDISEWLWTSFSVHEVRRLPFGAREPRPELLVARFASLVLRGAAANAAAERRRDYFAWLSSRLLENRFAVDPSFRTEIARNVRQFLSSPPGREDLPDGYEDALRAARWQIVEELPAALRQEVEQDAPLMASLGRRMATVASIGPWRFFHPEVWRSVGKAIDDGSAITTTVTGEEAALEGLREPDGTWVVTVRVGEKSFDWKESFHGLLSRDIMSREVALRAQREAFDCSNAEFERRLAEITTFEDPAARLEAARPWLEEGARSHYERLREKVQGRLGLQPADLSPPPLHRLLARWRLPVEVGSNFLDDVGLAAQVLLDEGGVAATLDRLGALPIALPAVVVRALESLSIEERRAVLQAYSSRCRTPISRLQCLFLLLRLGGDEALLETARGHVDWAARLGISVTEAFLSVLEVALEQCQRAPGFDRLAHATVLGAAWMHATELYSILDEAGAPSDWIRGIRDWAVRYAPKEILWREPQLEQDVASPRQIKAESCLALGLAYALSGGRQAGAQLIESHRDRFAEAFGWVTPENTHLARAGLLRSSSLATNAMGSFLVWREEVNDVLGEELAAQIDPGTLNGILEFLVERLDGGGLNDLNVWFGLVARLGVLRPPAGLVQTLEQRLVKLDFGALVADRAQAEQGIALIVFACYQKAFQQVSIDDRTTRALLESAARRLSELRHDGPDSNQLRPLEWMLLEACALAAIVPADRESCAKRLAELLRVVVTASPSMSRSCREFVQILADELPVDQAKWLWSLLTHLRSLP